MSTLFICVCILCVLVSCGAAAGGRLQAADSACGSERQDEVIGRVEAREGIPGGNEGGVEVWGCTRRWRYGVKRAETPAKNQRRSPCGGDASISCAVAISPRG